MPPTYNRNRRPYIPPKDRKGYDPSLTAPKERLADRGIQHRTMADLWAQNRIAWRQPVQGRTFDRAAYTQAGKTWAAFRADQYQRQQWEEEDRQMIEDGMMVSPSRDVNATYTRSGFQRIDKPDDLYLAGRPTYGELSWTPLEQSNVRPIYQNAGPQGPGYWQDPQKIARIYQQSKGLPNTIPDWIDTEAIAAAYQYLRVTNPGKPWWEWSMNDDNIKQALGEMPGPPEGWQWEGSRARWDRMNLQAQQVYTPTEPVGYTGEGAGPMPLAGLPEGVDPEDYPKYQQWIMQALQSPTTGGALQMSAIAGIQGALQGSKGGLPGLIIGGLGGAASGAATGGVLGGLSERIPALATLMGYLDLGAEWVERGIAAPNIIGALVSREKGGKAKVGAFVDALRNIDVVLKTGHFFYEVQPDTLYNEQGVYLMDMPWTPEYRVQAPHGQAGFTEIYDRIAGMQQGETLEDIYTEYSAKLGVQGFVRDMIGHVVVDPLNLLGIGVANIPFEVLGRITGNDALRAAAKLSRETHHGPITAAQTYGKFLREGFMTGLSTEDIAKANGIGGWLNRTLAGVDREGNWNFLDVPKPPTIGGRARGAIATAIPGVVAGYSLAGVPGAIAGGAFTGIYGGVKGSEYLFHLKPQAKATELVHLSMLNTRNMLNHADSVNELSSLVHMLKNSPMELGEVIGVSTMRAPEGKAIPLMFKDFTAYDQHLGQWEATTPLRDTLHKLARVLEVDPGDVIAEVGKNEKTADALLYRIIEKAKLSTDPGAQALVADFAAKTLTGKTLREMYNVYIKNGVPYDFDGFKAQTFSMLTSHADQWAAKWFGVKPDPVIARLGQTIKGVQSLALLGLNPTYLFNNVINNIVTMSYQGVMGFRTPEQIKLLWERVGDIPARLEAGVGIEGTGKLELEAIRKAASADDFLSSIDAVARRANDKLGIFSKASAQFEKLSSAQAYTTGFMKAWRSLWKPEAGYDRMSPTLEKALADIDPSLPGAIYAAISGALNNQEIYKALDTAFNKKSARDLVTLLSEQRGLSADEALDILDNTGIMGRLEQLGTNYTDGDVARVFDGLIREAEDHMDNLLRDEVMHIASEAANVVGAEGVQAAFQIFDQLNIDTTTTWFEHFRHMNEAAAEVDRITSIGGSGGPVWRAAFDKAKREWGRLNTRNKARLQGIMDAFGLNNKAGNEILARFVDNQNDWDSFYQLRDRTYERVGKGVITWEEAQQLLMSEYDNVFQRIESREAELDIMIVGMFQAQYGNEVGLAADTWRKGIKEIRDTMHADMKEHRELGSVDWNNFLNSNYLQQITELHNRNAGGAVDLYQKILNEQATATPAPEKPLFPTVDWREGGNQITDEGIRRATQAEFEEAQRMTEQRNVIRTIAEQDFGFQYTDDKGDYRRGAYQHLLAIANWERRRTGQPQLDDLAKFTPEEVRTQLEKWKQRHLEANRREQVSFEELMSGVSKQQEIELDVEGVPEARIKTMTYDEAAAALRSVEPRESTAELHAKAIMQDNAQPEDYRSAFYIRDEGLRDEIRALVPEDRRAQLERGWQLVKYVDEGNLGFLPEEVKQARTREIYNMLEELQASEKGYSIGTPEGGNVSAGSTYPSWYSELGAPVHYREGKKYTGLLAATYAMQDVINGTYAKETALIKRINALVNNAVLNSDEFGALVGLDNPITAVRNFIAQANETIPLLGGEALVAMLDDTANQLAKQIEYYDRRRMTPPQQMLDDLAEINETIWRELEHIDERERIATMEEPVIAEVVQREKLAAAKQEYDRAVSQPFALPRSDQRLVLYEVAQKYFNATPEQADALLKLVDARAATWAQKHGRTVEEYYQSRFGGFVKGSPESSPLYQVYDPVLLREVRGRYQPAQNVRLERAAEQYFGTTNNARTAGYLLEDGTMLDFGGGMGRGRGLDHREVGAVLSELGIDYEYPHVQFAHDTGAVRMSVTGDALILDIYQPLTRSQVRQLERIVANEGINEISWTVSDVERGGNIDRGSKFIEEFEALGYLETLSDHSKDIFKGTGTPHFDFAADEYLWQSQLTPRTMKAIQRAQQRYQPGKLNSKPLLDTAAKRVGNPVTNNPRRAGFLTHEGDMVDIASSNTGLSSRDVMHIDFAREAGFDSLEALARETGALRMAQYSGGYLDLEIFRPITRAQQQALEAMVFNPMHELREIHIQYTSEDGLPITYAVMKAPNSWESIHKVKAQADYVYKGQGTFPTLYQVSPEQARLTNMPLRIPSDDLFKTAISNTPGAYIDDDGIHLVLWRAQKIEQEGQPSVRGSVFYLAKGDWRSKYYKSNHPGAQYGGQQIHEGETVIRNPYVVRGGTGGDVPEKALKELYPNIAKELETDIRRIASLPSQRPTQMPPGMTLQTWRVDQVAEILGKYLGEEFIDWDLAEYIYSNSTVGNQLSYAIQERIVTELVRRKGYDAIIGVNTRTRKGASIGEVIDLRETHYPVPGEIGSVVHERYGVPDGKGGWGRSLLYQTESRRDLEAPPWYYSKLEHVVAGSKQDVFEPRQLAGLLNSQGIKTEELYWSGIGSFIEQAKETGTKITKAEIYELLKRGGVELVDVWRKDDMRFIGIDIDEIDGNTLRGIPFANPAERPGAGSFELSQAYISEDQRVVVSVSSTGTGGYLHQTYLNVDGSYKLVDTHIGDYQQVSQQIRQAQRLFGNGGQPKYGKWTTQGYSENYRELILQWKNMADFYDLAGRKWFKYGAHWDEYNPIAHLRVSDRFTPDGQRVIHLEEIQSDWHQTGRKKGYINAEHDKGLREFSKAVVGYTDEGVLQDWYIRGEYDSIGLFQTSIRTPDDAIPVYLKFEQRRPDWNPGHTMYMVDRTVAVDRDHFIFQPSHTSIPENLRVLYVPDGVDPAPLVEAWKTELYPYLLNDTVFPYREANERMLVFERTGDPARFYSIETGTSVRFVTDKQVEAIQEVLKLAEGVRQQAGDTSDLVPDAPFKKTWSQLLLKRAVKYAVDRGIDKLFWTKGGEQNRRYNLTQYYDTIKWEALPDGQNVQIQLFGASGGGGGVNKVMLMTELDDNIGQGLANHIRTSIESGNPAGEMDAPMMNRIALEATPMITFYEKIIPAEATKLWKRHGIEVKEFEIDTTPANKKWTVEEANLFGDTVWEVRDERRERRFRFDTQAEAEAAVRKHNTYEKVMGFEIPDSLRQEALGGQPLYQNKRNSKVSELVGRLNELGMVPARDVAAVLGSAKAPEYLQGITAYILDQRKKLITGHTTARDVIKGLLLSVASQNAAEARKTVVETKLEAIGVQIPDLERFAFVKNGELYVRPEDTVAAWLLTPQGKHALDQAEAGVIQPLEVAAEIRRIWGNDQLRVSNLFGDTKGTYNLKNMSEFLVEFNRLAQQLDTEAGVMEFETHVRKLNGIGTAKTGFISHLLGFGNTPTIDSVEQNLWLTGRGDIGSLKTPPAELLREIKQTYPSAFASEQMRVWFDTNLRQRFAELKELGYGADFEPEVFEHVMHHWVWDRAKGTTTDHKAMYDAMRFAQEAVAEGKPAFKGAIEFADDGKAIIYAMQSADISTLVHEIGHIFRRDLALEGEDFKIASEWAGAEKITETTWHWNREAEEKFARGFEKYLADGSAPTPKLKAVFEQFKTWLKQIYVNLLGSDIDVNLSPAIRDVFDRLLTTEVKRSTEQADLPMIGMEPQFTLQAQRGTESKFKQRQQQDMFPDETGALQPAWRQQPINPNQPKPDLIKVLQEVSGNTDNPRETRQQAFDDIKTINKAWQTRYSTSVPIGQYIDDLIKEGHNQIVAAGPNKYLSNGQSRYRLKTKLEQDYARFMLSDRSKVQVPEVPVRKAGELHPALQWVVDKAQPAESETILTEFHGTLNKRQLNQIVDSLSRTQRAKEVPGVQGAYYNPDGVVVRFIDKGSNVAKGYLVYDWDTVYHIDIDGRGGFHMWTENLENSRSPEAVAAIREHYRNVDPSPLFQTGSWFNTETGPKRVLFQEGDGPLVQDPTGEARGIPQEQDLPTMGVQPGTVEQHSPAPLGSMNSEAWSRWIEPLLGDVRKGMLDTKNNRHLSEIKATDIDPATGALLTQYLNEVRGRMTETKGAAIKWAEGQRDAALLNYNRRTGFDDFLQLIAPYHFWYTRSVAQWALRALEKPALYANYARARETQRQALQTNAFPSRLANKMRIPVPFLPKWAGGGVYVDPLHLIFPFEGMLRPIDKWIEGKNSLDRKTEYAIMEMLSTDDITEEQAKEALRTRAGNIWEQAAARAKTELDDEIANPFDLMATVLGPSLPVSIAYNVAKGRADKIGLLPITRLIQSITAWTKPGGINIEAPLRKAVGLPEQPGLSLYYVYRELANMTAEGLVDPEIAKQAMIEHEGAAWDAALSRSGKIAAAKNLGAFLWLDFFPEGEIKQRELQQQFTQAIDSNDPQGLTKFFEAHPEYEARMLQVKWDNPDDMMTTFLRGRIWDAWNSAGDVNRKAIKEALGESFVRDFLTKSTRNYQAIDQQTYLDWAQALNAYTPKQDLEIGKGLDEKYQWQPTPDKQPEIQFATPEVSAKYDEYTKYRDENFPNVNTIYKFMYLLPEDETRDAFRDAYPVLQQYQSFKDKYMLDNPELIPYLMSEENELYSAPPATQKLVLEYRVARTEIFGADIFDLQTTYFDLPKAQRKAYLAANPQLAQYWDWRRTVLEQYPEIKQYVSPKDSITSMAQEARSVQNEIRREAPPTIPRKAIDDVLAYKLEKYYRTNGVLGQGAKGELRRLWRKYNQIGGTFEKFLQEIVPRTLGL